MEYYGIQTAEDCTFLFCWTFAGQPWAETFKVKDGELWRYNDYKDDFENGDVVLHNFQSNTEEGTDRKCFLVREGKLLEVPYLPQQNVNDLIESNQLEAAARVIVELSKGGVEDLNTMLEEVHTCHGYHTLGIVMKHILADNALHL